MKACIIGVSGYGQVHYNILLAAQAAGTLEIAGATIINQDEEAEKCDRLRERGGRIFDDYREMLRELGGTATFCMIPTGTPLHRPMTIAALEAGMHVLVEKPAAGCIEDVRAMQEAAVKAGKIVAVGYQHLYSPAAMAIKEHILAGTIGRLQAIKCLVLWPRNHNYYGRNQWAGTLKVGNTVVHDSPFNNAVAHDLMMMLFQAGETRHEAATPVRVQAELYRANAIESADTACMQIETANDIPIRFYATHACLENFGPEIHISGTKGSIVMTHGGATIKPAAGEAIYFSSGSGECLRENMLNSVLDVVQGGRSFICDLAIACRQTMVVSMIHETCTIQTIAGRTHTAPDGTISTVIPGIEDALRRAFDAQLLLQDAGGVRMYSENTRDDASV